MGRGARRGRGGRGRGGRGSAQRPATVQPATAAGGHPAVGTPLQPVGTPRAAAAAASCLICAEESLHFAVGACDHPVCGECALKLRVLYDDKRCPVCKAGVGRSAIVAGATTPFAAIDFGALAHDRQWGVFLDGSAQAEYAQLKQIACPECDGTFDTLPALRSHCSSAHQLSYCKICLEHRKVFLRDQRLMKRDELREHMAQEHPACQFCKRSFYDNDALFAHMTDRHHTCPVCERNGVQFLYFKDYANLEDHFRSEHFLCPHPRCLEQKFVVFGDQLELNAHNLEVHGEELGRGDRRRMKQVETNFTVRPASRSEMRSRSGRGRAGLRQASRGAALEPEPVLEPQPEPEPPPEPQPAAEQSKLSDADIKEKNRAMVAAMRAAVDDDATLMKSIKVKNRMLHFSFFGGGGGVV